MLLAERLLLLWRAAATALLLERLPSSYSRIQTSAYADAALTFINTSTIGNASRIECSNGDAAENAAVRF